MEEVVPTKRPLASDAPLFELGDVYRVLMYRNKKLGPVILESTSLYVRYRCFPVVIFIFNINLPLLCVLQGLIGQKI